MVAGMENKMKSTIRDRVVGGSIADVCDIDGYINLIVTVDGREYRAGGAYIHTEESAARANACEGLQPEQHPDIYWPGAVGEGDLRMYRGDSMGDLHELCVALVGSAYTCDDEQDVIESLDCATRKHYQAIVEARAAAVG